MEVRPGVGAETEKNGSVGEGTEKEKKEVQVYKQKQQR